MIWPRRFWHVLADATIIAIFSSAAFALILLHMAVGVAARAYSKQLLVPGFPLIVGLWWLPHLCSMQLPQFDFSITRNDIVCCAADCDRDDSGL